MQPHIKNYLKAFGYDESSFIKCEMPDCSQRSVDIHHIVSRSKFGSKRKNERDAPDNLIALCRNHHDKAHGAMEITYREIFQSIANERHSERRSGAW